MDKSKIVVFKKGPISKSEAWTYGGDPIKVVTNFPFLGLVFSSNGLSYQAQKTLADQANKAIFQLHKRLSRFKYLDLSVVLDLFDKYIAPILNYACEVWGFHNAPEIERVQLSFYKRILGVRKCTQLDFIYGLTGRYPLTITRHFRIIKYWLAIVSGTKSAFVTNMYMSSLSRIDISTNQSCSIGHLKPQSRPWSRDSPRFTRSEWGFLWGAWNGTADVVV